MATSPETSDHTDIKTRIETLKNHHKPKQSLEKFVGSNPERIGLPFVLRDYLELIDWTGRILREEQLPSGDKRRKINAILPPILERLALDQDSWHTLTAEFERKFGQWVGSEHIVRQMYSDRHYQRIPSSVNLL